MCRKFEQGTIFPQVFSGKVFSSWIFSGKCFLGVFFLEGFSVWGDFSNAFLKELFWEFFSGRNFSERIS